MITNARARRHGGACRHRSRPSAVLVPGVVAALVGAACAQQADWSDTTIAGDHRFAASTEYLAGVAATTEGQSYRMSMDMSMTLTAEDESLFVDGTFMTGDTDGERTSMTMDLGEMFRDIADQMGGGEQLPEALTDELTIDMVVDDESLYMRAPFFAVVVDEALDAGATQADLGPLADLAALGDGWGRIDLAAVSPSEAAGALGSQSSDPSVYLDIIGTATDVHELGTETIDGVETRGLEATVTYRDMITAQDLDLDDVRDQLVGDLESTGELDPADVFDEMLAWEIPVEVWVDGNDRVRRIVVDLDMTDMIGSLAEAAGEEVDGGMAAVMTMDFTDYGAPIEIAVPSDAVDITDEYLDLIEAGGLGAGPSPVPG